MGADPGKTGWQTRPTTAERPFPIGFVSAAWRGYCVIVTRENKQPITDSGQLETACGRYVTLSTATHSETILFRSFHRRRIACTALAAVLPSTIPAARVLPPSTHTVVVGHLRGPFLSYPFRISQTRVASCTHHFVWILSERARFAKILTNKTPGRICSFRTWTVFSF